MKFLLIILCLAANISSASEKKYFQCEMKAQSVLHLTIDERIALHERKEIAVIGDDGFTIYNLATFQKTETYDVDDFYIADLSFSPDGRFILVHPMRKGIYNLLIDRKTKKRNQIRSGELFWLKDNHLGWMDETDSGESFFYMDPVQQIEVQVTTPGLTDGFWYGFDSINADLVQKTTKEISVYSLKEKQFTARYSFDNYVHAFDVEKNFAITKVDKLFTVIRLSDYKTLATFQVENEFSYHVVGSKLFLADYYGWFSSDKPDRRTYHRAVVDLKSQTVTKDDYTGPWQSLTAIDDQHYMLQVIDSGAAGSDKNTYYSINSVLGETVLKVVSPADGFTSLSRIDHSKLFAISPPKKYAGQMGFFSMNHPDRVLYNISALKSMDRNDSYVLDDNTIVNTTYDDDKDYPQARTLTLWKLNQNCSPAEYRF